MPVDVNDRQEKVTGIQAGRAHPGVDFIAHTGIIYRLELIGDACLE